MKINLLLLLYPFFYYSYFIIQTFLYFYFCYKLNEIIVYSSKFNSFSNNEKSI